MKCFTTHQCDPPVFGKHPTPKVNVTDKLKKHWDHLPEHVQDCLRTQLRDRTVLKLDLCSSAERNGSMEAHKHMHPSPQFLHKLGFKQFFVTKARVNYYLEKCQFEKGGDAYESTAHCVDEITNHVKELVCARVGSCQFEHVSPQCLSPNHEYRKKMCKCYDDQLKITLKHVEALLKKSATGEVTVEELDNAMGQDEADSNRDRSAIKKCFKNEGLNVPTVVEKSNTTTSAPFSISEIYTENIIVNREQLINVQMMLEARIDDEECKCISK